MISWATLKKFIPYIIIIVGAIIIYNVLTYYANKVEELSTANANLKTQLTQVNMNYETLQNMYNISIKQNEELQKNQRESLEYVNELKDKLSSLTFSEEYLKDKERLLKKINEYERCYAKNTIKNPSYKCYKEN